MSKFKYFYSFFKFNASKNYYQTLNLTKTATQEEIKQSYYNLAKIYHPDKNPNGTDKFKAINEAYEVLKNPTTKKDYDDCQGDPQAYQKKQYERQHQQQHKNYDYSTHNENFRRAQKEFKGGYYVYILIFSIVIKKYIFFKNSFDLKNEQKSPDKNKEKKEQPLSLKEQEQEELNKLRQAQFKSFTRF